LLDRAQKERAPENASEFPGLPRTSAEPILYILVVFRCAPVMSDTSTSDAPSQSLSGDSEAPLIAIMGPTASGKSALAVTLAERFGAEVLACDSTQVYRGFDIGTAKPTREERRGIPHHLMDLVDANDASAEPFTAGEYRRRAVEVLANLRQGQRLPILTVGTGLYLRALLEGLAAAPGRSEKLRERLNASGFRRGGAYLHALLHRIDPATAARISPNDRQKLVRALEIRLLSGKPVSEVHHAGREPLRGYSVLKIGLQPQRTALYDRIGRRVRDMLERGWLAEVDALLVRKTTASTKPFEFIGYRELRGHLEFQTPLAQAIECIAQATRRYAKRQFTWFRKEPNVEWFAGFGDDPEIVSSVSIRVARHLDENRPDSVLLK
jgi:tRNA dimethylallyltransferase